MEDPGLGILIFRFFRGFLVIFAPFFREIEPPKGGRFLPLFAIPP